VSPTLLDDHDALLLDLDGTVYRGEAAIDGAAEVVTAAHDHGVAVRFVTNNASRAPETVAEQLTGLGVAAEPGEISTSAQAAARMLAERLDQNATVLVVGAPSLADEVREAGLRPVPTAGAAVGAVVQGLSKDIGWRELAEATVALNAGALWVACNIDPTLPTERGLLPGNGAMVAALRTATGREPLVAGKPARPLMDDAVAAAGSTSPLVVGDRLDTDIAGAVAAAVDALFVLSGVSTAGEVIAAPASQRPRYLAGDIRGVLRPAEEVEIARRPAWTVRLDGTTLRVSAGRTARDAISLLRTLCAVWWSAGSGGMPDFAATDESAASALSELGLPAGRK